MDPQYTDSGGTGDTLLAGAVALLTTSTPAASIPASSTIKASFRSQARERGQVPLPSNFPTIRNGSTPPVNVNPQHCIIHTVQLLLDGGADILTTVRTGRMALHHSV